MDRTIRGGCAARSVIAVSMLRGPPRGHRRPPAGRWYNPFVRLSRLVLLVTVLAGALTVTACGDSADDAVDRARSEVEGLLDRSGLRDELDRTYTRVDDLLDDLDDATGAELRSARRRAERALEDSRARIRREIREARRDGATEEELQRLRKEAQERLDDLRERIDQAFEP
jgi:ElaB/YqjD/DUF883 family membrane-anchored ribosome-binding protein